MGESEFRGGVIVIGRARPHARVQKLLRLSTGHPRRAENPPVAAPFERWVNLEADDPVSRRHTAIYTAKNCARLSRPAMGAALPAKVDLAPCLTALRLLCAAASRHDCSTPTAQSLCEECGADALTTGTAKRAGARPWASAGLRFHGLNCRWRTGAPPAFATKLGALLRHTCLSPHDLTLEVTESRFMSLAAEPLETLVRLRMQRFGLSIDDFGTGHSSLAQLRDVPFTELKIDRGFVHGARHNQLIRPMLEGSCIAHAGLQTVAEGVESADDWALLREIGCDVAQGYFIGRPMPGAQLPAWWADWQARRPRLIDPAGTS